MRQVVCAPPVFLSPLDVMTIYSPAATVPLHSLHPTERRNLSFSKASAHATNYIVSILASDTLLGYYTRIVFHMADIPQSYLNHMRSTFGGSFYALLTDLSLIFRYLFNASTTTAEYLTLSSAARFLSATSVTSIAY